jgi:hypothetical protein
MTVEESTIPLNLTIVRSVEKETGQRYGHILSTLSQLFGDNSRGAPPAVFLVEAKDGKALYEAGRVMAQNRNLPVIFADSDLAVDEIHGAPVGRIESTGDSLFRKIDETGAGIVVINGADQVGNGSGLILERIFDGKPLTLPGLSRPIDFSRWTVVMGANDENAVSPGLKNRANAVIHFDGQFPRP